jgi:hypothetical protein
MNPQKNSFQKVTTMSTWLTPLCTPFGFLHFWLLGPLSLFFFAPILNALFYEVYRGFIALLTTFEVKVGTSVATFLASSFSFLFVKGLGK